MGALRATSPRRGERCKLLWRKLAYGRLESDALAVALDRLDDFCGERAAAVIVIPEQSCHDHLVYPLVANFCSNLVYGVSRKVSIQGETVCVPAHVFFARMTHLVVRWRGHSGNATQETWPERLQPGSQIPDDRVMTRQLADIFDGIGDRSTRRDNLDIVADGVAHQRAPDR
jgi:hypothetical protein